MGGDEVTGTWDFPFFMAQGDGRSVIPSRPRPRWTDLRLLHLLLIGWSYRWATRKVLFVLGWCHFKTAKIWCCFVRCVVYEILFKNVLKYLSEFVDFPLSLFWFSTYHRDFSTVTLLCFFLNKWPMLLASDLPDPSPNVLKPMCNVTLCTLSWIRFIHISKFKSQLYNKTSNKCQGVASQS